MSRLAPAPLALVFLLEASCASLGAGRGQSQLATAEEMLEEGRAKDAIPILRREVKRSGNSLRPRLLLAGAYLEVGDIGNADRALSDAVGRWPEDAEAHLLFGYCRLDREEVEQARSELERALELSDDPSLELAAHLGLASIHDRLGDGDRADEHYARALAIAPETRDVLIEIQKELVWRPSVSVGKEGTWYSDSRRRDRIEAALEELLLKESEE